MRSLRRSIVFGWLQVSFVLGTGSVIPSALYGYGYLAEFVGGSTVRIFGDVISNSDSILTPRWISSPSNLVSLKLCTNSGGLHAFSVANIAEDSLNGLNLEQELLSDISSAQATWQGALGADGSALSFDTPMADAACANNTTTANRIFFTQSTALVSTAIAITVIDYSEELDSGQLVIESADIYFNANSTVRYSTGACTEAGAGCYSDTNRLSFQGVLAHELGHLLGLSHSLVKDTISGPSNSSAAHIGQATMYPRVANIYDTEAIESLHLDDELSLFNLYYPNATLPSGSEGVLEGTVYQATGDKFRGAHLLVVNADTKRMIAGAFSGIFGTAGISEGGFRIRGLPTGTNLILIAEPVDQPDYDLSYSQFSAPIDYALEGDFQGYANFPREAYPDQNLGDLRDDPDLDFGSAEIINLAPSSATRTDLNFYLSDTLTAPNDNKITRLELSTDGTNLTVTLANPAGLTLANPTTELSVTAEADGRSFNWSRSFGDFTLTSTESAQTKALSSLIRTAGTYSIRAEISDANAGVLSDTLTLIAGDTVVGSSGGGCSLQARKNSTPMSIFFLLPSSLLIIIINIRKRFSRVP